MDLALLSLWHEMRRAMPKGSSIRGFREALCRHQRAYLCEAELRRPLDRDMLGNVYDEYVKFLAARDSCLSELAPPAVCGPFSACPACHKQCQGLATDANFKCKHFSFAGQSFIPGFGLFPSCFQITSLCARFRSCLCARFSLVLVFGFPSVSENGELTTHRLLLLPRIGHIDKDEVDWTPFPLFLPYSKAKPHVERSGQGGKTFTCTTAFTVDNVNAKSEATYDIQGVLAVVCRHYIAHKCVILWHGERYGYPQSVFDDLVAEAEAEGVTLGPEFVGCYDVGCRFKSYVAKHSEILKVCVIFVHMLSVKKVSCVSASTSPFWLMLCARVW